jgi:urease gamma subunit
VEKEKEGGIKLDYKEVLSYLVTEVFWQKNHETLVANTLTILKSLDDQEAVINLVGKIVKECRVEEEVLLSAIRFLGEKANIQLSDENIETQLRAVGVEFLVEKALESIKPAKKPEVKEISGPEGVM